MERIDIEHKFQELGLEVSFIKDQSTLNGFDIYFVNINEKWSAQASPMRDDNMWMLFLSDFHNTHNSLIHWMLLEDDNYHGPFSTMMGSEKEAGSYRQKTNFKNMINFLKRLKNV